MYVVLFGSNSVNALITNTLVFSCRHCRSRIHLYLGIVKAAKGSVAKPLNAATEDCVHPRLFTNKSCVEVSGDAELTPSSHEGLLHRLVSTHRHKEGQARWAAPYAFSASSLLS